MRWIAFFSQTGTEILNVSNKLGKLPDKIITNASIGSINKKLLTKKPVTFTISKPTVGDYIQLIGDAKDVVVTLHGWLRIIPGEVCKKYNIWNLHPGLITKYPELKGIDPQEKVFPPNKKTPEKVKTYEKVGLVIHKVIPEVDAGPVELEVSTNNTFSSIQDLTERLHTMATSAWFKFFQSNEMV